MHGYIDEVEAKKINFPVLKQQDDNTRIDDEGTIFEFDSEMKAWFPKINEASLQQYQDSYCHVPEPTVNKIDPKLYDQYRDYFKNNYNVEMTNDQLTEYFNSDDFKQYCVNVNTKKEVKEEKVEKPCNDPIISKPSKKEIKDKKKLKNVWKEIDVNYSVYVSNLPLDLTRDEFKEIMCKYGVIFFDERENSDKIKLYKTCDDKFKGDAICTYAKVESVDLSTTLLDGMNIRGNIVSCEEAKFEQKGKYDPKKRRRGLTNKEKLKSTKRYKQLVEWKINESDTISEPLIHQYQKRVVIENVFTPDELTMDPDLKNKIKTFFSNYCKDYGTINKIIICENNQNGVVVLYMSSPVEGVKCAIAIDNCLYMGRQLSSSTWDGKTNHNINETEESEKSRIEKWHNFIETDKSDSAKYENAENTNVDSVEQTTNVCNVPKKTEMDDIKIVNHYTKNFGNTSRNEIIKWVNDNLYSDYAKIEEFSNGVVYILLMDKLFTGKVPLKRAKINTTLEYEKINNLKILQNAFSKLKVDKVIPIERLVKGKFQDNLEFVQWFKKFYELNSNYIDEDYDPLAARGNVPIGNSKTKTIITPPKAKLKSIPREIKNNPSTVLKSTKKKEIPPSKKITTRISKNPIKNGENKSIKVSKVNQKENSNDDSSSVISEYKLKLMDLQCRVDEMESSITEMESERNFYFGKLRDIETICQSNQENELFREFSNSVLKVLYETTDGFERPDEIEASMASEKDSSVTNNTRSNTAHINALANYYMKSCDGYMIVYALDNEKSFEKACLLHENLINLRGIEIPHIILGNKIDMCCKSKIVDILENYKQFSENLNYTYFPTCARYGTNVNKSFQHLINLMYDIRIITKKKKFKFN
ncbi:Microtubule-associated protein RP/EB family member 2 [Intoshia linei]|uniref:Microtubule-associated protein RP/EB family member 2 n=1 Tax=Intoshia linei TaxID=1819745 RepID=A0A177BCF7_9BILA|nr:Microtubule-associated protein RP/EB family member 2 [Intoshia linei]